MLKYFVLLFVSTSIFAGTVGTPYSPPSLTGTVTSTNFVGNASGLTNLSASALVGTVPDERLSTNVSFLNSFKLGFVGDSITDPSSSGWTTNLMQMPFFAGWQFTNKAVSGSTTWNMRAQVDSITNWLARLSPKDQHFCWVYGGLNDEALGTNTVDSEANLIYIWSAITNAGAVPIMVTLQKADWLTSDSPLSFFVRSNYTAYGGILFEMNLVFDKTQGTTYSGPHPNALGNGYISRALASVLQNRSPFTETTEGTNRFYFGVGSPIQMNIGVFGKTNLFLSADGSMTFKGSESHNNTVVFNKFVRLNGGDGAWSPAYLSIGSDDTTNQLSIYQPGTDARGAGAIVIGYSPSLGGGMWTLRMGSATSGYNLNIDRKYGAFLDMPALTIARDTGFVGINTTNIGSQLSVNGGVGATTITATNGFIFQPNATCQLVISNGLSGTWNSNGVATYLRVSTVGSVTNSDILLGVHAP